MIVRLKGFQYEVGFEYVLCFNSMIVRLKENYREVRDRILMFQFYDSPIKRKRSYMMYKLDECFNSMIVRLKESLSFDSSINFSSFNSMIVRLKAYAKHIMEDSYGTGFNSMIVRLKEYEAARFERAVKRFQFYDSPIKSRSKRQKTLLILNNLSFNYINKLTNKVVEAQR